MQNNPMALIVPVRGPYLGLCEFCTRDSARIHCDACGQGNFCAPPCLSSAVCEGLHRCPPTPAKESEAKSEADCEVESQADCEAKPKGEFEGDSSDSSSDESYLIIPADYILHCAVQSELPNEPMARQCYFFHRCETKQDEYNLLSVYKVLKETCGIKSGELTKWRLDNVVYQETVRAFIREGKDILPSLRYWLKMKESRDIFETPSDVNLRGDPLRDDEIENLLPERDVESEDLLLEY